MKTKGFFEMFIRYIILLLIGLLFYFTPFIYSILFKLTIVPSFLLINLFSEASLSGSIITLNGLNIEIIPACVALSAYFLLLILNLTTKMSIKKRVISLIFTYLSLLIFNVLRISLMTFLFLKGFAYFSFIHLLFWYVLSTVFVVGIWFLSVKLFKIKSIPVYTDIKLIKD